MALPALLKNNLELPVVGSPLFIVSGPELVIADGEADGLTTIAVEAK